MRYKERIESMAKDPTETLNPFPMIPSLYELGYRAGSTALQDSEPVDFTASGIPVYNMEVTVTEVLNNPLLHRCRDFSTGFGGGLRSQEEGTPA